MNPINPDQNNTNYISCPSCETLFKPKASNNLINNTIKCVFCDYVFNQINNGHNNLKYQASIATDSNQLDQLDQLDRLAEKIEIPNKKNKPKMATEGYLKRFKLKSRMLFLLWILIPMFCLDQLVSTIIKHKDELAQDTNWRDSMVKFCNFFSCELPTYSNLDSILIEDNALVASEEQKNTIQLHAMLNNTAGFDQKYPNLKINFTDINGNLITKKIITPEQYIKNYNAEKNPVLEKNSKQYVSILIDDPGKTAVNYEIDLTS